MKVVAINSSPKMDKGITAKILAPFLRGMKEAGAEVELFYTKKLKINPCHGKFTCSLKTPGKCFQKDDMQMLHPKLLNADIWVFATPVYLSGVTGPMKNLMDRILIPMGEPQLGLLDGHSHHFMREKIKHGKIVLVSNCGYWEMDNFNLVVEQMIALSNHAEREFVGALLRPHGPAFESMVNKGAAVNDIIDAAKEAGRQLVQSGMMSPETLKIISRELIPLNMYVRR